MSTLEEREIRDKEGRTFLAGHSKGSLERS